MPKDKNILILAPTDAEAKAIEGVAERHGATVMVSGVGTAETAATLARLQAEGRLTGTVILTGIAGARPGSGFVTGDCAVASSETLADLGAVRGGGFLPLYPKTYDCSFAGSIKSVRQARFATVNCVGGADTGHADYEIENMEGAAFFAVCTTLGIHFLELRSVSNMTEDPREKWNIPLALEALATALDGVLKEL